MFFQHKKLMGEDTHILTHVGDRIVRFVGAFQKKDQEVNLVSWELKVQLDR